MPNVAIPVTIMLGLGASAGAVAHRRIPGFWRASVAGGIAGMLLWIGGTLALVGLTEGLGWQGAMSIFYLLKAVVITSCLTMPAAIVAGWLMRLRRPLAASQSEAGPAANRDSAKR